MRLGTLFFLLFLWFMFNVLRRGGTGMPVPRKPLPPEPPLPPQPPGADPTQQEGRRLEALLGELRQGLDEVTRVKRSAEGARPEAGSAEAGSAEASGAETTRVRTRRETDRPATMRPETRRPTARRPVTTADRIGGDRPERAEVDQDETAAQVAARRIAEAEARSGALTDADHARFRAQIRQEPADHTAVRVRTAGQLRDAIVWREILGPPVALRGEKDDVG